MSSGRLNDELNEIISKNKKFVLFKSPNQNKIKLFAEDSNNLSTNGFVINNFENTEKYYIYPEINLDFTVSDYDQNIIVNLNSTVKLEKNNFTYLSKLDYLKTIRNAIALLDSNLTKVVISRIINWENNSFNALHHFIQLCKNKNSFSYLIFIPNTLCWIGSTPELLLKYKNKKITTVSLAGTKKNSDNWTEKELEEQKIVTNYIENLALENNIKTNTGLTKTISVSNKLNHLKSIINSEIVSLDIALNFLNKLHPTPAICGFPKIKAIKIIKEIEKQNRDFYTGYIGLEEKNNLELYVNLRCACIYKDFLNVYVGSGITKKSIPEKEWEETELKSKTIIF